MKPKIKDNAFIDSDGREWTPENLQDLVDATKAFVKAKGICNYYYDEDDPRTQ